MQSRDVPEVQKGHLDRLRQPRHAGSGCVPSRAAVHLPMIEQVSVAELQAAQQAGPVTLIDVREQAEYESGHVPGAEWIPMSLVPLRADELAARQPAYIICRTGNRSGQVCMYLAQRGIRALNVDGGTEAWQRLGLPILTTEGVTP